MTTIYPLAVPSDVSTLIAFQVGNVYLVRSIGDQNCIWHYKVVSRTAKMVTLQEVGESKQIRCKVSLWRGVETCKPHGSYSRCAILSADKQVI